MAENDNAVGGKIGDVSGLPVGGKIGDVSGDATFQEVQDLLLRDRSLGSFGCLEARVNRLEYEILSIARWLDIRLRILEERVRIDIERLQETINEHGERLDDLEGEDEDESPKPPRPQPPRES